MPMTRLSLLPWKFATRHGLLFDIGRPTRAELEVKPNRLSWYHNRGVLTRPAARCL